MRKRSFLTVTDQFCGAGGSSIGATSAGVELHLALNHWELAIETHNTNFPDAAHDCADISAVDPRRYPSTDILITSPECTNHSIAKGSRRRTAQLHLWEKPDPAEERSRATMWDVPRFAEFHDYRLIIVENVVDARAWVTWDAWIHAMDSLGYDYQVVYLNSMFAHLDPTQVQSLHDFAPQSRDRMYVVFWKKGNKKPDLEIRPKAWCLHCETEIEAVQSWLNTPAVRRFSGQWGRYGRQYIYCCPRCSHRVEPWRFAAFNAIDWSLDAPRIGDRDQPLKPKTLKRIEQGLAKYGQMQLIIDTAFNFNGHSARHVWPMNHAAPTFTTAQTMGLVAPHLLNTLHGDTVRTVTEESPTQTGRQSLGLAYLVQLRGEQGAVGVDDPLATFTAGGTHHGLCLSPSFLTSVNDFDGRNLPVHSTMGTQTTQDKWALTMPPAFLSSYYGMGGDAGMGEAMGTLTSRDRHALVRAPFLLGYANQESPAKGAEEPLRTFHTRNGQGLVMPELSVEDCHFRMLQPHEIGRGMAFPETYVVLGTKREKVKLYGNAVTPPAMKLLVQRGVETLR